MAEATDTKHKEAEKYAPPAGSVTEHEIKLAGGEFKYKAHAEWIVLRKKDKPVAEMFHVAYLKQGAQGEKRPVTFVFNGGPGAASAYLHLGAIGPRRVAFNPDGTPPRPPVTLAANEESWLAFTDLVFVDPIGTGFSRVIDKAEDKGDKKEKNENEFYHLDRDMESLGEFIQKFLSAHARWESPVFIAGESYGGFRSAALAKRLQQNYGVGLNGVVIISPALDLILLDPSDYDIQGWADEFPTFALTAVHHGRSRKFPKGAAAGAVRQAAEAFAQDKLLRLLAQGEAMPETEREAIFAEMADFIGVPAEELRVCRGRVPFWVYSRRLLKDQGQVLGFYDSSVAGPDPYPDRENFQGPDPSLGGSDRVFTSGINAYLRHHLALQSDRDYHLLNREVNKAWKIEQAHAFNRQVGVVDELRFGMALNPHMQVLISHGYYDMVTPYFSSERLVRQMRLDDKLKGNISLRHFPGGHMFYTWEESRREFFSTVKEFFAKAA